MDVSRGISVWRNSRAGRNFAMNVAAWIGLSNFGLTCLLPRILHGFDGDTCSLGTKVVGIIVNESVLVLYLVVRRVSADSEGELDRGRFELKYV